MAEALERPVCTATIADDDTVEVTVDRVPYVFDSMPEAIDHLVGIAGDLGRAVKVTALDPASDTEPEKRLIIEADGSVSAAPAVSGKKRPSRRSSSRPVTLDDLAPATEARDTLVADREAAGDLGQHEDVDPAAPDGRDEVLAVPAVPRSQDGQDTSPPTGRPTAPVEESDATVLPPGTESGGTRPADPGRPATAAPAPSAASTGPTRLEREDPQLHLRRHAKADPAEAPARAGWRGWCNTVLGLSLAAAPAERAARARRVRIQRPLSTHRTVAVLQLKGGGGKTTAAYHLAATYGRVRGGNILAGEFNENQGTLAERSLTADHDRTTLDLIRNLETVTRRTAELVRYVRPQGDDRIHVLASPPEGTDRSRVDGRSVRTAHETLRSLYGLILLDTGNSAQSSTWRAAVDVADSLVLVAHNREDDARLLEATVAAVTAEGHGEKLVRSLLVVSNTATDNQERITRLQEYAAAIGLAGVVIVPFDKSLQEGQAFHYEALHSATRRAYEEATAVLTDQL